MNRLRDYWDEDDDQRRIREKAIKRERSIGAVLMLGLFSLFPIVVLACNDDTDTVVDQASIAPATLAARPVHTTIPEAVVPVVEPQEPASLIPENPTFEDGESAFGERRYDDATEIFSIWAEQHPDNVWGHYMFGLSALRAERYVDSETGFATALEVDPRHVKSLRNVTRLYLRTGRPEEAFQDIQFAIEIDPESGESYRLLALTQDQLGLTDDATESYQHALTLDSTDVWSMNNLGLLYIEQGRFDEALKPLARATQLRDNVPVFFNNLGVALERTGYEGDAIDSFRKALALDSSYHKAEVSLERVESRDAVDVFVADLEQLAQSFVDELVGWRQPVAATAIEDIPVAIPDLDETPVPVEETSVGPEETETGPAFEPVSFGSYELWVLMR